MHMTVNYKRSNARSIVHEYLLSGIENLVDSLGSGKIESTIDLLSGLFQSAIHPEDIDLTVFITPQGLYNKERVP